MYPTSIVIICLYICINVRAQWNTKDFLKREHSLVKPYQVGELFLKKKIVIQHRYICLLVGY